MLFGNKIKAFLTQTQADGAEGLALSNVEIQIVTAAGDPSTVTGKVYNSGISGVSPSEQVTSSNISTVLATAGGAQFDDWTAATVVKLNQIVVATGNVGTVKTGDLLRSNSARTTGATFNASELTNWAEVSDDPVQSVAGKTGVVVLVKGDVGLGSADNTADTAKPISTATQVALSSHDRILGQALVPTTAVAHPLDFSTNTRVGGDGTYTVSQSSIYNSTYDAWRAFDNSDTTDTATLGVTGANTWNIGIVLPVAKIVTRMIGRGRPTGTENPTAWRIEASQDGVTWVTLHTSTTALEATAITTDFTNATAYLRYRLFVTASSGFNPGMSRLEFHEAIYGVSAATPTAAGTMSAADKTKLDGVATGAEVNVQADWAEVVNTADAFITNKPTLGTAAALNVAASGDAAVGEVVKGNDTRMTDSRTPATHNHDAAYYTKAQADTAYLPKSSLAVTPIVLHPENFAATTATGTAGTYTVSASSEFSATYAGWKCFDNNDTTDWATLGVLTNFWVRMVFPAARIVTSIIVRGRNSGSERITSWIFQGSQDGTTWTDLFTSTTALGNTAQTFMVSNSTAYLQYRLFANTGEASNPGLSRLTLRGDSYSFGNPVV